MNFILQQQVRSCTHCIEHLPLGAKPILQINPAAKILLAGQAPGRVTHQRGYPFDDVSGDRLRQWLGVSRESFYDEQKFAIVPMGFCYPGTTKSGDLPPRPECAELWRQTILDSLVNIEFTIVIGRYAIAWHLPQYSKLSVTEAVASVTPGANIAVFPHPSPRNNRWLKNNTWFEASFLPRIRKQVHAILSVRS